MDIYVISLKRTPKRLAEFQQNNRQLHGYKVFAATDGFLVDTKRLVASGHFDSTADYKRGAIGNALSHLTLWEEIMNSGKPAVVCEDDAILHPDFAAQISKIIARLKPDWDFLMLGWNFDTVMCASAPGLGTFVTTFKQDVMRAEHAHYLNAPIAPTIFKLINGFGTLCYAISTSGAEKMFDAVRPIGAKPILVEPAGRYFENHTLDVLMNDFYKDMNCHVCVPPLAISLNDKHKSTVIEGEGSIYQHP